MDGGNLVNDTGRINILRSATTSSRVICILKTADLSVKDRLWP